VDQGALDLPQVEVEEGAELSQAAPSVEQ
jgi:hypothetical protein